MSNLDPVKAKQSDNSNKLQNQTLEDIKKEIQEVERGNFTCVIDGVNFTGIYTKCGKLVEFEIDVTLTGGFALTDYTLCGNLPYDVYNASGVATAQVGPWLQCWGKIVAVDRRLVLYLNSPHTNPITVQGSVICFIK